MQNVLGESNILMKNIDECLVATIRYNGSYKECTEKFGIIGRKMGIRLCGAPINLLYNMGYLQENTDIECCMPIRKGKDSNVIAVKQLPSISCISLVHKGPYETIGDSYKKILAYMNEQKIEVLLPTREVYIKGPGMLFKIEPHDFLTEIQIPIK